jgi:hypothetical protein
VSPLTPAKVVETPLLSGLFILRLVLKLHKSLLVRAKVVERVESLFKPFTFTVIYELKIP